MATITETKLNQMIRKVVKEVMTSEISRIVDDKLEELSDDIAKAVNEVVDLKMDKKIKEIVSKRSIKDKIVEGASREVGIPIGNDDYAALLEPAGSTNHDYRGRLSGMQKTGMAEAYMSELRGGNHVPSGGYVQPQDFGSGSSIAKTGIAEAYMNDYNNQNYVPPLDYTTPNNQSHAENIPSVDELMSMEYDPELLEGK